MNMLNEIIHIKYLKQYLAHGNYIKMLAIIIIFFVVGIALGDTKTKIRNKQKTMAQEWKWLYSMGFKKELKVFEWKGAEMLF